MLEGKKRNAVVNNAIQRVGGGQRKDKKKRKCSNKKQVFVAVLRARSVLKHVAPKESSKKRVLGQELFFLSKKKR